MKLKRWHWFDGREYGWAHWCPACEELHQFAVDTPQVNGAHWSFDGNMEAPTFNPSMLIKTGPYPQGMQKAGKTDICHYFLHNGQIVYQGDCTHDLRGQTVPLPDFPHSFTE